MKFKKKITFLPAFDRRDTDPKKNYGIHGVEFTFFLIGEKGVIQFRVSTNWQLPHVQQEQDTRTYNVIRCGSQYSDSVLRWHYAPKGFDLGYHSPHPVYDGQTKMNRCDFFEGGCYYDGSSLQGEEVLKILIEKGSKGVWKALKKHYKSIFEKSNDEKTMEEVGFGQVLSAICGALKTDEKESEQNE